MLAFVVGEVIVPLPSGKSLRFISCLSGTGLVPQSPEGRLTLQYSFTVRFIFANTLICWIFESSEAE